MLKKIYELIYDHTMSTLFILLLGTWCLLEMVFGRKEKP